MRLKLGFHKQTKGTSQHKKIGKCNICRRIRDLSYSTISRVWRCKECQPTWEERTFVRRKTGRK